jgi:glycosyltransferase involved in cell wall biosynthesis
VTAASSDVSSLSWMVLIPAYNEENTIKALLEAVLEQKPGLIVVVNDASRDTTAEQLKEFELLPDIKIIHNKCNLGKAGSLWRGFDVAIAQDMELVVTLDGDGQHRPEDIPLLLQQHILHTERLIIGAREKNLKTQPLGRFLANRFANFWISWAAGYVVKDSQSGFRLYPVKLLKKLDSLKNSPGFVFESEVIIESAWQGHYTSTVTIPTIYHKNRRPSHFKPWQDIKAITKMVARRLLRRRLFLSGLLAVIRGHHPDKN